MKYNTFTYSLKVWLTSIVLAPTLVVIIAWCRNGVTFSDAGIAAYVIFTIFGLKFSFVTWVLFWLIIKVITLVVFNPHLRQWLIFAAGIILTVGTFFIRLSPFGDPILIILMLCHCACVGAGSWFYKLKPLKS